MKMRLLLLDNFALAFTIVFSVTSILWFISAWDYFTDDNNFSDHFSLVLFTLTGGFILVSFTNMVMLFLGIEILSIPLFVLVGSNNGIDVLRIIARCVWGTRGHEGWND